jgi:hypothetical protein
VNLYKYAERYPSIPASITASRPRPGWRSWKAARRQAYLLADHPSLADAALLPLMRQFAGVEPQWFAEAAYPRGGAGWKRR